ncbi:MULTISPECIES: ADP-forming succinate--CoA ligase subunit beta [Spiribacter]|jgi:succinyl-CoA synthetase beta subunit|uniref:Succinate--CoA ligase [ADP-forming] subunit beta n=2 Tax=Spiribacter TaxID=1335745 RepID=A0A557RND1_9GAMM|nr:MULTISPECIES: ADP-forming succinate--CoA ligase subunit beta [Spiribacter]PZA01124.1 ADP-forming succinate--CoA ligase subunit beta [Gammaproteobacteria bacterium 2W06]KAF0279708.1 succinate--CoA ligase subunit beta [Spiribacter roseus]KAF0283180.1 succinate--CoA ligase subunit beta [Spiribacter roseus]KAF0285217.1 succinate--CoA ligase subunit beta [Spiribacter sp. SSL99]TVO66681.1 ADP-forming succinate--CoA ligase subunit beta [Spiribacter aquaticus]
MNLHEFQAKHIFSQFGIPIPRGFVARSAAEARSAAQELGGSVQVVKAQVHAGGRGKAGGVKLAKSIDEVGEYTEAMLGTRLVTHQTDEQGMPINAVMVEEGLDIAREIYLGALVDRASKRVVFMGSAAGGMDIEEVAATEPEKIVTVRVNPVAGLQPYQCRQMGFALGLTPAQIKQLTQIMKGLYRCFEDRDLSLIEINPLIVTADDSLLALDAKINVDDNAIEVNRQPEIADMRDLSQEDETEVQAAEHGLNYITLDGNIGCMVNGAGLAMATMDVIKLHGGEPANFLDVGGGTNKERVTEAFKIISASPDVQGILVNIFGGIVRCDMIAEGVIAAVKEVGVNVPVVVRLEGTNVEQGKQLLADSGLDIIPADDLTDGADKVVGAVSA